MNSDPPPPSTRRPLERQAEGLRGLRDLSEFSLQDVDAVRLILKGDSVIDWHRLNLTDRQQAVDFIRNHELDRVTQHTIANPDELLAELKRVRNAGFAFDRGEGSMLAVCIGAPILDSTWRRIEFRFGRAPTT